jgi:hypothetical protein
VGLQPQGLSPDIGNIIYVNGGRNTAFDFGTGAGQVNTIYSFKRMIISPAAPDSFAISKSLVDPAGNLVGFAHIAGFRIANLDPLQSVTVKSATTAGVTFLPASGIVLPPYAEMLWQDPYASTRVVAGTSDQIVASISSGSDVGYVIEILGCDV